MRPGARVGLGARGILCWAGPSEVSSQGGRFKMPVRDVPEGRGWEKRWDLARAGDQRFSEAFNGECYFLKGYSGVTIERLEVRGALGGFEGLRVNTRDRKQAGYFGAVIFGEWPCSPL